jgi:hypothetical protein
VVFFNQKREKGDGTSLLQKTLRKKMVGFREGK